MTDLIAVVLGWAALYTVGWAAGNPELAWIGCLFFPVFWVAVRYGPDKE